jgi:hypothetical protein
MTDDDDEPTGMDGEIGTTAAVPVSPRTVAAERYSELGNAFRRAAGTAPSSHQSEMRRRLSPTK